MVLYYTSTISLVAPVSLLILFHQSVDFVLQVIFTTEL